MESSPILVPGSGYVPDAPSATTTLANTQGATGDDLSFSDVLDAINPLQHLPIISTIYREATGSEIKTLPNLIGGAIFGGIFGLIGAAVDSVVKEASGSTIGHHLLAAVGLADDDKKPEVTVTDVATGEVVPEDKAASNAIVVPGAGAIALKTTSIMLDEASGQPADFAAERIARTPGAATQATYPLQRSLVQPAVAQAAPATAAQAAAAQQPTDFYRSLQRANFSHQPARPLQTLSTIETSAARSAKTKTTAAGATANDAVAVEPAVAAPAKVGAPTSILPQAQAGSMQPPSVAQAQATLQANPESFNANMMAALEKYQAMRGGDAARTVSITQ
ncbi:hypothetical protein [Roseiterribacter gracilis]|uniref:Uncharacterized protein n=1 Tax=Roseiterribacter gracilis TaxID=2812848 RepID=A0A8S8XFJ4_9PROT|nr:hypothetical protein TMPK1_30090 [Rhodospirillales bacterium TMPK1]